MNKETYVYILIYIFIYVNKIIYKEKVIVHETKEMQPLQYEIKDH